MQQTETPNVNYQIGDLVKFRDIYTNNFYMKNRLFLVHDMKYMDYDELDMILEDKKGKEWHVLLYEFGSDNSYWWDAIERFAKISQ